MLLRKACFPLGLLVFVLVAPPAFSQISKGHQILINRGLQLQGLCQDDVLVTLSTYTNLNYTGFHWVNNVNGSTQTVHSSRPDWMGAAPGYLPWGRWAADETQMPPHVTPYGGDEAPYMSQLMAICLADEWDLNNDTVRTRLVNWFNSVRSNWPNALLFHNNWGSQVGDSALADFYTRAQPDMLCFDTYPWQSVWSTNYPNNTGPAISGPPTDWYGDLRRYREHARGAGIPLGLYRQTFHAVQDYDQHVFRDPSKSELRLLTFAGLAFNVKFFNDFLYNTGAASLFTKTFNGSGDTLINPTNGLYAEMADANKRAINFGKSLVRLTAITNEANAGYTSSILFIRGKDPSGSLTTVPVGFLTDGSGNYTTWNYQRNDPYLTNNWVVTNKAGIKNNGNPGEVIISWFRSLNENYAGPNYTNELYMMVVNGLTDPTGTAADCLQEIQLNFATNLLAVEMVDPLTGNSQLQSLPLTNGFRRLTLNLNGGDGALFRFAAPGYSLQPSSRTNIIGSNASLAARAVGASTITYQWQFNGAVIPGATATTFTRTNSQTNDSGNYTLVASNSYGSVTSAVAALTVVSNISTLFLYEPFDYTNISGPVTANTSANWTTAGSGPNDTSVVLGSLAYSGFAASIGNSVTNGNDGLGVRRLWGTNVNSGVVYMSALLRINTLGYGSGWSGAVQQIGSIQDSGNNARHQIVIKSNSPSGYVIGLQKSGTGSAAVMDTTEYHAGDTLLLVGKYDFRTSPNTASLWINPSASTFSAASEPASGFLTRNDGTNGTALDRFNMRQNANSLPTSIQWDELRFGLSWADVTAAFTAVAPQITAQPTNKTVSVGSNVTFTVTATGTDPLNYQWRFNGTNISGASTNSYNLATVQRTNAGSYSVLVSNSVGSIASSNAVLTVTPVTQLRFGSIIVLPGGIQLQGSGDPGYFAIDVSSNLVNWSELTNFFSANSTFSFMDPIKSDLQRYYRARLSP